MACFTKNCYSENYFLPKFHKGCIPLYFVTKHVIHRSYLKSLRRWNVDVYGVGLCGRGSHVCEGGGGVMCDTGHDVMHCTTDRIYWQTRQRCF